MFQGRPTGSSLMVLASLFIVSVGGPAFAQQINPARDLVNPFIGTGGHGHTFPGACVPNGLVQLSPDTRPDGVMDWDGCGGYHYSDSVIYGFSHTHLSGTGVADLCDVLITPVAGSGGMAFDGSATRQRFSHSSEVASAGYYKVDLLGPPLSHADGSSIQAAQPTRIEGSSISAELTATAHVGVHRYQFPKGQAARIVLNLSHRDKLLGSGIQKVSETEVVGERRSSSWAKDQRLFFCIRSSSPILKEDVLPSNLVGRGAGYEFGALDQPLIVKMGISAVSIEGARANLDAEVPGWDFDAVRAQAESAWNAKLNKIQLKGGTEEQQRIFYTALYHCYVAPYEFNDVDGNYRGMDGEVHHADHKVYTVFSLWDTFRALHPLMTILEPEMTSDWIKTFLLHYQQSGRLPVWELWGNETDCMIGYHSVSVIADAYLKGIGGFDTHLALEAMLASAMRDEPGLNAYRKQGFISGEDQSESVSRTLEYAYDDGCIASFARAIGTGGKDHVDQFEKRARSHTNLLGPDGGFYRARRNGGFVEPFDPFEVNFSFTEANAWQYSLFAPQDPEGLIRAYGGMNGLETHLDALFRASSVTSGREQSDITGLIGQYAHGNEPSHHMAYLYNAVDRPEKTRAMVKMILDEQYRNSPDGLSGNEDCGQMSAWYVLSALGVYPVSPGISDRYELGYPLFDQASIDLPNGEKWSVVVDSKTRPSVPKDASGPTGYIPASISHTDIMNGGPLVMDKDRVPHRIQYQPGTSVKEVVISDCDREGAPYISAAGAAFREEQEVTVHGCGKCMVVGKGIKATCDPGEPFMIDHTTTVSVQWDNDRSPVVAKFTKIATDRKISLDAKYANQYAAGGDQALVDGLRGGSDFRTGEWQGFEGQDLLATIDLGKPMTVKRAGLSALQDQRSWIWLPSRVQFAFSTNGRQWSTATVTHEVPRHEADALTKELWTIPIAKKARYVKVIASYAGPCPDWHPGKGGTSWIFADEVLLEFE